MALTWTKENSPRWDADKQRIFGPAELAAVGLAGPAPGEPVADEWWRVTDGDQVAGYGWLDTEWGDACITFVVTPTGSLSTASTKPPAGSCAARWSRALAPAKARSGRNQPEYIQSRVYQERRAAPPDLEVV